MLASVLVKGIYKGTLNILMFLFVHFISTFRQEISDRVAGHEHMKDVLPKSVASHLSLQHYQTH